MDRHRFLVVARVNARGALPELQSNNWNSVERILNAEETEILARIEETKMRARLNRAAQWTPEMIVAFQDAFIQDRVGAMAEKGTSINAARASVQCNFDIWEHNSLNAFGRRA